MFGKTRMSLIFHKIIGNIIYCDEYVFFTINAIIGLLPKGLLI